MHKVNSSARRRLTNLLIGAVFAASSIVTLHGSETAVAATLPTDPPTVTAEPLPTWQLNGVVWSTVVVGNTAYVTGEFTQARPPGQAVGSPQSVPAGNIFAFDVTSGNPVAFNHSLNGQGLVIRANEDGTRLYVGGDFTTVDNNARGHIAAFDLTKPGGPLTPFDARTDGQVRGFALINNTVYAGGNFRSSNGQPRKLLAAYAASSGNILSWAPDGGSTGYVWSMVAAPDKSRVIVGGSLTTLNGVSAYGMGALDAQTGETLPWAANQKLRTAGTYGAIDTLSTDGVSIFGAGYAFGAGATFEGSFSANPTTGEINWMNNCLGDTYDTFPMDGVLYTVGHEHDCTQVDAFPDTNPRNRWQNATAERIDDVIGTYTTKDAYGWDFIGLKYTGLLQWFPTLAFGNYTSSMQAAWSIGGNGDYLVLAGEFPKVNGVNQQALTRFAKRGVSKSAKPTISGSATPTIVALSDGKLRVVFDAMYDRDDANLLYDVYRSNGVKTTRIATIGRAAATFWNTPVFSYVDADAPLDEDVRYQIRGRDSDGNDQWSAWSVYARAATGSGSVYADAVASAAATHHWRLADPSDSSRMLDVAGDAHGTPTNVTFGVAGALLNESNAAITSQKATQVRSTTEDRISGAVTVEAWVKTSSSRGGRIVGIGSMPSGNSTTTDRVLYLDNAGRPNFTITDTARRTVTARNAIRDNQWHHVVGVGGESGMELFVDGVRVARDQRYTQPTDFTGYWRLGADSTVGFSNRPTDAALAGQLDEVAVYPHALTLDEVQAQYTASGRSGGWGARATGAYGEAVIHDEPDLFWRLGEASGVALDSSGSGDIGTVSGTVTRRQAGPISGSYAATFNGSNGMIVAQQGWSSPGPFTAEIWFKTNTTKGGKLIGFGNTTSGLSAAYDRHIWMLNDGKLAFGTYLAGEQTLTTSAAYNDNSWHHVAATQGTSGMRLYVDGVPVGSNALADAEDYVGYWRIGGDRVWSGTSSYFSGGLAEAAVYPSALSADEVLAHYVAAGGTAPNRAPVANFTTTRDLLSVSLDGSSSVDPDGPIGSYEWTFGDGATASNATASHTYAEPGTYPITLTVQDLEGLSSTMTQQVTVVANEAPVAAFVATVTGHSLAVDASAAQDLDGNIVSYAWDFGDSGAGTGKTATHEYGEAGTFSVTLTVTDNRGATHHLTKIVQTVDTPNVAPAAAFTDVVNALEATLDASASQDPDGSIVSYTWDFGDGTSGTGMTTTHTYATAGNYQVKLTVTDNKNATDTATKQVTATTPPQGPMNFAADTFERSLATGLGNADTGGAWTLRGAATNYSVTNGMAVLNSSAAGATRAADLTAVSSSDTDMQVVTVMDKPATGGGTYVTVVGRRISTNDAYNATLQYLSNGTVQLSLRSIIGGTESVLKTTTLPGISVTPGDRIHIRLQVTGTSPTTLQAKAWKENTQEPTTWQVTTTHAAAPLQTPGSIGVLTYLSGSSTNAPVKISFDNLTATTTD